MTDLQGKKDMLDSIQKKMTHACMRLCFSQQSLGVSQHCIDDCYHKYAMTLAAVHQTMMAESFACNSRYGFILDRDRKSLLSDLIYGDDIVKYKLQDPSISRVADRSTNKHK